MANEFVTRGGLISLGGITFPYVGVTGTYTVSADDYSVDCISGTFTVTLPISTKGKIYVIKNSGEGTITVNGSDSDTIDGTSSVILSQYESLYIQYTGSSWIIDGPSGATGATGASGSSGSSGTSGTSGSSGSSGISGSSGSSGTSGSSGSSGSSGTSGSSGSSGTSGSSGSAGTSGSSGTSPTVSGSNNQVLTANGSGGITAESNLTFDGSNLGVTGSATISGPVGIGTITIDSSAVLDIQSNTGGLLPPRMTGAELTAISSAEALLAYSTDATTSPILAKGYWYYNGTAFTKVKNGTDQIMFAISDETTVLTAGTNKITFRMPRAFYLTSVRASLTTAQTSGPVFTADINQSGSSILSTKITIDNNEKTSVTAATGPVISTNNLTDDAEITVDIDQVGLSPAGCKIYLLGFEV